MAPREITDNVWHHLAFTFDGDMGRLYVDGELETEKPNTNSFQSNAPITIGVPNIDNKNGLLGVSLKRYVSLTLQEHRMR